MIAPLAKFIDWSALQMAYAVVGLKHAPKPKWKLEEALEFLNGPDFIPAASDPARIEFDGPRHFKFPTPRPCTAEENNIVYGRLYRCAERWQERPVIILLDGYPPIGNNFAFPLLARRVNRAGFNVATLVAPYNLQRRPRRPIEENCLEFARTMAQNVAEIRALAGWLLDEGCSSVGLLGVSFGTLLIKGIHDLFGDPQLIEELWQKWEQPEIWRLPHGHISALFVPGLTGRVLRWLSPRLNLQPRLQPVHSALP